MYKLGFRPQKYYKSIYYDGHERPDLVASRTKFIEVVADPRKRSRVYVGENLEHSTSVNPEKLADNQETIFIYHDESTVHAKERPQQAWLLPGTTELRSKNEGRLIHISDFILEASGRLFIPLDHPSQITSQQTQSVRDAATVIYPGSKGDAWWNMEQLCRQIEHKAIPIFNALHPDAQEVFVFDCSSAHEAYSPTALRVQNMNIGIDGNKPNVRDTIIPCDDPNIPLHLQGLTQQMYFPSNHPTLEHAGKPKGIKVVLEERGLYSIMKRGEKNLVSVLSLESVPRARHQIEQMISKHNHLVLFRRLKRTVTFPV